MAPQTQCAGQCRESLQALQFATQTTPNHHLPTTWGVTLLLLAYHFAAMEEALMSSVGRTSTSVLPLPQAVPGGRAAPLKLDAGTRRHDFHDDPVWEFIEEIWGEVPTFVPVTELLVFAHPLLSNE